MTLFCALIFYVKVGIDRPQSVASEHKRNEKLATTVEKGKAMGYHSWADAGIVVADRVPVSLRASSYDPG